MTLSELMLMIMVKSEDDDAETPVFLRADGVDYDIVDLKIEEGPTGRNAILLSRKEE